MTNSANFDNKIIPIQGPGGGRNRNFEKAKVKDKKGTILKLWKYISFYKIQLIVAVFCVVISTITTIIASYMVRPIINGVLNNSGMTELIKNLVFMLIIYLLSFIANYLQSRIMLEIAQKALEKLRTDLYDKLQQLPLRYFDTHNNGDIMSRFTNDIDAISQMLSNTFVNLISAVITLVGTLAIMVYTSWALTLVTIIMLPVFSLVAKFITEKNRVYYRQKQKAMGDLNGFIEETISGQKIVKVFNHEAEAIENFDKYNKDYNDKVFHAQFLSHIMGPTMGMLGQLNYAITAVVGGLLCVFSGFDIGGYTIFVNYSRKFSRPINELSTQVNSIFSALAGAERVFEVMEQQPEKEDIDNAVTLDDMKGNISIKNVFFGYRKDKIILKDISLDAKQGEKIAFVGSTGAGKTTITNLLNRFYDIHRGTITIDGVNINDFKRSYLRKNIAMVLQDTHLFTGTIRENIRYGNLEASDEDVIKAAKAANAHSFIKRLEKGYDTVLDGDGSNLSQGQRQLLNIARAAISKAPILVLDEATSSVDTRTEKNIEEALDRLMSTRTTLVIAHRLSTVRNAKSIMVLENGEIIERGNHYDLLDKKGKYYSLYTGVAKLG